MGNIKGRRVRLKDQTQFIGVVKELHLKADEERSRKNDLYLIDWDNGKQGIAETKDLIFLD
jgi:hypothetical protein